MSRLLSIALVCLVACGGDDEPDDVGVDSSRSDSSADTRADAEEDTSTDTSVDSGSPLCSADWPPPPELADCPSGSPGATPPDRVMEVLGSGVRVVRNLHYGTRGERALVGDLFLPEGATAARGVVVTVHGGGWNDCSNRRANMAGYAEAVALLFGVPTFNVEYRLVREGGAFPNSVGDVSCALGWLKSNADEFGIVADDVVMIGTSAGGHLALMAAAATTPEADPALRGECGDLPNVLGVISYSGPSDMPDMAARSIASGAARDYAGACEQPVEACSLGADCDRCVHASPLSYACAIESELLLIYAADPFDPLVPESQATRLADASSRVALRVVDAATLRAGGCLPWDGSLPVPGGVAHGIADCLREPTVSDVSELLLRLLRE